MEALIETIVKPIVDHPGSIRISVSESDNSITYRLAVHPDDTGKIIGKHGRIAKAIRVLLHAKAGEGKTVYLDIK